MRKYLLDPNATGPAADTGTGIERIRVVLVNPPLSEPSGPYPAICYLAGFLDTLRVRAELADLSLELVLRLFSRTGLEMLRREIDERLAKNGGSPSHAVAEFLRRFEHYAQTVDTAVAALQGADQGAVVRAARADYFPPPFEPAEAWARSAYLSGQQFEALLGQLTPAQRLRLSDRRHVLRHAFGMLGQTDEARFRASSMLYAVARVVREGVDPHFELNAYAERISKDAATFAPIAREIQQPHGLIARLTDDAAESLWRVHRPHVVGLSVPFPCNVVGAFRIARRLKELDPAVRVVLGGGWVNTNLRDLSDPEVFDYVDYVTLDDGERPLQCILEVEAGLRSEDELLRTFIRRDGRVVQVNGARQCDVSTEMAGTPTYRDLPIRRYLPVDVNLRLAPRMWSRRWNKLTLAKGCYWKKCTFCDTRLAYIARYEPASVDGIVDRVRRLIDETGETGFHFVDEAMPPALLRRFAERLIADKVEITWWGNVRFDAALAPLAPLLAESGCYALTGGLEVASDRLLALMEKGVTLQQVVHVTHAFARAGVIVHAYLIYGFPTQTGQETIDALEFVRQLFEAECVNSVYWHRFTLTAHSPVAANPERFGVRILEHAKNPFTNFVLSYDEPGGIAHGQFGAGLRAATQLYMNGFGFDRPLPSFFEHHVPSPSVAPDFVRRAIARSAAAAAVASRGRADRRRIV